MKLIITNYFFLIFINLDILREGGEIVHTNNENTGLFTDSLKRK